METIFCAYQNSKVTQCCPNAAAIVLHSAKSASVVTDSHHAENVRTYIQVTVESTTLFTERRNARHKSGLFTKTANKPD